MKHVPAESESAVLCSIVPKSYISQKREWRELLIFFYSPFMKLDARLQSIVMDILNFTNKWMDVILVALVYQYNECFNPG